MTIKECIDIVDNIKPNQYTIKDKVMWLSFIDEIIINEVLKTHEGYDGRYDLFEGYTEDKLSVTLIVPSPYDRLYTAYLKMKIDGENGETARYNNSVVLYNTYMQEYRKHYNKTHMPLDTTARRMNVKHPDKPTQGLSDAEYENLKRDLTFILTEYFSDTVSPDKLNDAINKYLMNNVEVFKGKDGYTPKKGVDYWTEEDKTEVKLLIGEKTESTLNGAKAYADKNIEDLRNEIKSANGTDAVYSYEFVKDEHSADEFRAMVFGGPLNKEYSTLSFTVYGEQETVQVGDEVVFYNPNSGDYLVGRCDSILPPYEGAWDMHVVTDKFLYGIDTLEEFKNAFTHWGVYKNEYSWKSTQELLSPAKKYTDEKIGDIDAALDEIIAIQNGILGVSE